MISQLADLCRSLRAQRLGKTLGFSHLLFSGMFEALPPTQFHILSLLLRLAGDQRARRDSRHDSDAEDDDDVKKVRRNPCIADDL